MKLWHQRTKEIAYLFNPAFCGEIIRLSIKAYQKVNSEGMPISLAFLVLPIILHKNTRINLPTAKKYLHAWIQENPEVLIGFSDRASELVQISREAILFLLQKDLIVIQNSCLKVKNYRRKNVEGLEGEASECFNKALTLGTLLSKAGTHSSIYAMFGVKP